ncbi:DoxX family protein [Aquimarina sp. W85]|uniref:DoxX family protein n=1 Tax=Aquimarina rhodophyticola TaxID=3342246 RepID=UPI00366D605B
MKNLLSHLVPITILVFLFITFFQSAVDKLFDFKGNKAWLQQHFATTILAKHVPLLLSIVLILESVTAIGCILGVIFLLHSGATHFAVFVMLLSCITLLALLFGQRVAKDYPGALTITCYFIVAIFGLYVVNQ